MARSAAATTPRTEARDAPEDADRPWFHLDALGATEVQALARGIVLERVRDMASDLVVFAETMTLEIKEKTPMTTAVAEPPPTTPAEIGERFERLTLEQVIPSKTNPRTHFDEVYLKELAASILTKGLMQPIIVRPFLRADGATRGRGAGPFFEIVAGECRYRATQAAGLSNITAIIRHYTDEQVLELQLIENLHRKDLSPLEQAAGYRRLIDSNPTKHSAESIATRLGMSPQWVWDRMKLNDLVPEAKKILEAERMTVGHAILIARLKPEDQKRVIDVGEDGFASRDQGLWEEDAAGLDWDEDDPANAKRKPGKYDGLKAKSVRELESWINDHIRFDVTHAAKAQPLTFEPLAAKVEEKRTEPGRGKKVIAISFDHFLQPEARDGEERTYGPKSFKFADGQQHVNAFPRKVYTAATCEHAVLGVVAAGERRGESFDVCIARDKCQVHWGKEIKDRTKNQKLRESGKTTQAARREAAAEAKERREREQREKAEARWNKFRPALSKAAHAATDKVSATLPPALYAKVLQYHQLPKGTKPAQLAKALLEQAIAGVFDRYSWRNDEPQMVAWAKLLGVDVKACEPKAEPVQTSGAKKAAK